MAADHAHRDFLERALTSAGEWARFADPKALAVLVIMGLGLQDLVSRSHAFLLPANRAHDECPVLSVDGQSCTQVVGTAGYCAAAAAAAAVLVVLLVTAAVFPRLRLGRRKDAGPKSVFYFENVARHQSAAEYAAAVRSKSAEELETDLAGQVYAVSVVASRKHKYTTRAYLAVLAFLLFWVVARVALGLAE